MTNPPQTETQVRVLSHSEADALLARVNQELSEKTFDASNDLVLKQMVECLGDTRGLVRLGFAAALGRSWWICCSVSVRSDGSS